MAEKHLRNCSASLVIREMHIKTTLRFHLTPVRMAKIKYSDDSRCWLKCGERGTLLHCWWGCKLVQPLWKSVWRFLRKLKTQLFQSAQIPQRCSNIQQRHMHHHVHSSPIYNIQKLERTQMSFSRWMNTKIVVYLHNGVLLSYQKQWLYEILKKIDASSWVW